MSTGARVASDGASVASDALVTWECLLWPVGEGPVHFTALANAD